jgi:hypothetical protein
MDPDAAGRARPGDAAHRRFLDGFPFSDNSSARNNILAQVRRCGQLFPKGAGSISGLLHPSL